jgi:hypothetical protein
VCVCVMVVEQQIRKPTVGAIYVVLRLGSAAMMSSAVHSGITQAP